MQRIELQVNGRKLDTPSDFDNKFYFTEQNYDYRSLDDRKAGYSREIKIIKSRANLEILDLRTNEPQGNQIYDCDIIVDGITFSRLSLLLINSDDNYFFGVLYDNNFDLYESIGDSLINDLNLTAYNFPWTQAGIGAIKTNTDGCTSVATQFIDEDSLDDGTGVIQNFVNNRDLKQWGFGFYYKTLITEILAQNGWNVKYADELANDQLFLDLLIACPVILQDSLEDIVAGIVNRTSDYVNDASVTFGTPDLVSFSVVSDPSGMWNVGNNEWVVPTSGEWRAIFEFTVIVTGDASLGPAEISILQNGTEAITNQYYSPVNQYDRMEVVLNATAGDTIRIETIAEYRNQNRFDILTIASGATFSLQQNIDDPTTSANPADYLPELTQKTALKGFLKIFNALLISNSFEKTTEIVTFNEYAKRLPIDLSNNLDVSAPIERALGVNAYFQKSFLRYTNDSYLERTDVDAERAFNDQTLEKEGTILQIPLAASDDDGSLMNVEACGFSYRSATNFTATAGSPVFSFGQVEVFKVGDYIRYVDPTPNPLNDRIDRIRFASSGTGGQVYGNYPATLTNVDVQIIEISLNNINPRIFRIDRNQSIGAQVFTTINGYTGQSQGLVNVNRAIFSSLNAQFIRDNYYEVLFGALDSPAVIKCWMVFKSIEFFRWDPARPVYVSKFEGFYHVNIIDQFKLNVPCQVELVRITKYG